VHNDQARARRRGHRPEHAIKYLRHATSGAAGSLDITIKYLVNRNAGADNNWTKALYAKAGHEFLNPPVV